MSQIDIADLRVDSHMAYTGTPLLELKEVLTKEELETYGELTKKLVKAELYNCSLAWRQEVYDRIALACERNEHQKHLKRKKKYCKTCVQIMAVI